MASTTRGSSLDAASDVTVRRSRTTGDEADLAAAASEVKDRLALEQVGARVAAAVVAVGHLLRDNLPVVPFNSDGTLRRSA